MPILYLRKIDGVVVQAEPIPSIVIGQDEPTYMKVHPAWVDMEVPILTPRMCPGCGQFIAAVNEAGDEVRFIAHDCVNSGALVPDDAEETPETAGIWMPLPEFENEYELAR